MQDNPVNEVTELFSELQKSGLTSMPEKRCYFRKDVPEDVMLDGLCFAPQGLDTASSMEISTCTAVLNFYRLLCGLPPVRLNSARLQICNIVSIALLARQKPSAPLGPDSADFVDHLSDVIAPDGASRVSILHGEASLIAAVEQSLSSTHTCSSNAVDPVLDTVDHAGALAERVGVFNPDAVVAQAPREKCRERKSFVAGKAPSYDTEPQPLFFSKELPAPLKPLRVLWDLQTGLPKVALEAQGKSPSKMSVSNAKSGGGIKPIKATASQSSSVLSSIWGDRHRTLAFRRCLLSPALKEFGVARRHDSCVLWTSTDQALEEKLATQGANRSGSLKAAAMHLNGPSLDDGGSRKHGPSEESPRNRQGRSVSLNVQAASAQAKGDTMGELGKNPTLRRASSRKMCVAPPPVTGASVALGAVCWPPTGIVPLKLVLDRQMAWTIMPDSLRFQPTESTQVRMWKVKVDRSVGISAWTADRVSEVVVRGFAVDCSSHGEPFCVIFWPDFGVAVNGCQLEVELSGLRGARTKLNFFYEFHSFQQAALDERLCAEASTFRALIGDRVFWGQARELELPPLDLSELKASAAPKNKSIMIARRSEDAPKISIISHQEAAFTTNSVDTTIVIQSDEVVALRVELLLVRFSGEEELVLGGALIQKLPCEGNYFLLRAKLPMRRQRFEIRLWTSTSSMTRPADFKKHPLSFFITTSSQCQALLSTLEDPRKKKFGYCLLDPTGQLHGIVVIAPIMRRIAAGTCYFLVYVNKSIALAHAEEEREKAYMDKQGSQMTVFEKDARESSSSGLQGSLSDQGLLVSVDTSQPGSTRLYTDRLEVHTIPTSGLSRAAKAALSMMRLSADTIEGDNLTPVGTPSDGRRSKSPNRLCSKSSRSKKASIETSLGQRPAATVGRLQANLHAVLEKHTQDTAAEVQLDVSLRGGEIIHRLKERTDFPGFFEGLFSFSEHDVEQTVQLYYRFPMAHSFEYAPRKLGDWFVVKDEHLPPNF
jgi:hypothetical protein